MHIFGVDTRRSAIIIDGAVCMKMFYTREEQNIFLN
jgi:hypothetical protein